MEIFPVAINNKKEIAGYFSFGKYNQKKNSYTLIGHVPFFWNGCAHILSFSQCQPYRCNFNAMKLNNNGTILIPQTRGKHVETYIWSIEKGLTIIPDFYGMFINDLSMVVGRAYNRASNGDYDSKLAMWRHDSIVTFEELLNVENIENLAPSYSDNYAVERIQSVHSLNNKGQILCQGHLWGENHPCLLEPN